MKANHKCSKRKWIEIKRGQFVSSYWKLSKENGLWIQQIRTAIDKLKSTNEITSKATNKYTLFTVVNYSDYQDIEIDNNKQDNKQNNNQVTTNNNNKNNIKRKYIKEKDEIRNLLDEWYVEKNWYALKILYELFIDKSWYKIEAEKKEIEKFVDRLKRKSKETFWYDQVGNHKREYVYNTVEECFDYHEKDKSMIKKQSHKGRINTWFKNKKKGW